MIAAYQRISRADGDLGKDGKDGRCGLPTERKSPLRKLQASDGAQFQTGCSNILPGTVRAAAEQAENFLNGTRLTASMVSAFIENVFVYDGGRIVVRFKYEQSIQDAVKALHTG